MFLPFQCKFLHYMSNIQWNANKEHDINFFCFCLPEKYLAFVCDKCKYNVIPSYLGQPYNLHLSERSIKYIFRPSFTRKLCVLIKREFVTGDITFMCLTIFYMMHCYIYNFFNCFWFHEYDPIKCLFTEINLSTLIIYIKFTLRIFYIRFSY